MKQQTTVGSSSDGGVLSAHLMSAIAAPAYNGPLASKQMPAVLPSAREGH